MSVVVDFSPCYHSDRRSDWLSDGLPENGVFGTKRFNRRQNNLTAHPSPYKPLHSPSLSSYSEKLKQKIDQSKQRCLDQQAHSLKSTLPLTAPFRLELSVAEANQPEKMEDLKKEFKNLENEIRQNLEQSRLNQQHIQCFNEKNHSPTHSPLSVRPSFYSNSFTLIFSAFLQTLSRAIQQIWLALTAFVK